MPYRVHVFISGSGDSDEDEYGRSSLNFSMQPLLDATAARGDADHHKEQGEAKVLE